MPRQDFYIKKPAGPRPVFADLYNAEIFHGKQILKAELLSPVSTESGIAITNRSGRKQTIQRRRDIAMKAYHRRLLYRFPLRGSGRDPLRHAHSKPDL